MHIYALIFFSGTNSISNLSISSSSTTLRGELVRAFSQGNSSIDSSHTTHSPKHCRHVVRPFPWHCVQAGLERSIPHSEQSMYPLPLHLGQGNSLTYWPLGPNHDRGSGLLNLIFLGSISVPTPKRSSYGPQLSLKFGAILVGSLLDSSSTGVEELLSRQALCFLVDGRLRGHIQYLNLYLHFLFIHNE